MTVNDFLQNHAAIITPKDLSPDQRDNIEKKVKPELMLQINKAVKDWELAHNNKKEKSLFMFSMINIKEKLINLTKKNNTKNNL